MVETQNFSKNFKQKQFANTSADADAGVNLREEEYLQRERVRKEAYLRKQELKKNAVKGGALWLPFNSDMLYQQAREVQAEVEESDLSNEDFESFDINSAELEACLEL